MSENTRISIVKVVNKVVPEVLIRVEVGNERSIIGKSDRIS